MNFFVFVHFLWDLCLILIRKHISLCLMSLEIVVISLLFMIMYFLMFGYSLHLYMVFMTFFVCKGVLVFMIRCHGDDNLNSFLW